jgi:hypothetical protein
MHEAEGAEGRGYPGRRRATPAHPSPREGWSPLERRHRRHIRTTTGCKEAAGGGRDAPSSDRAAAGALAPRPQERPRGRGTERGRPMLSNCRELR